MKTLKVFFVLLPFLLGACNPPTEPNIPIPPKISIIATISSIEMVVTATTATVTSFIKTNGPVSVVVKYGVGNYDNVVVGIPTSFNVSTYVDAKLLDLIPSTRYQLRIQVTETENNNNVVKVTKDTVLITNSLQIGDSYQDWKIFSLNPLLGFRIIDEYQNWEAAKITASSMGGYLSSVAQQLILFSLKEKFGLTEFTYWTPETDKDEPNLVVSVIFNSPSRPEINGQLGLSLKTFIFKSLVVREFK